MSRIVVPQHVDAQIMLAARGTDGSEYISEPSGAYLAQLNQTLQRLRWTGDHAGKPDLVDGVEVYTLHASQHGQPACHRFLYRFVDGVVEIGHLLHDHMPLQPYVPLEWRVHGKRRA